LLTSNIPSVSYDKGLSLLNQARLPAAIDAFNVAVKDRSIRPKALNNLGICLALQEKHKEAILKYRAGIDASKDGLNTAKIHRNLAISLATLGEYKESKNSLKRAEAIDPKNLWYVIAKARLEFIQGNYSFALKIYTSSLNEIIPYVIPCLLALGDEDNALFLLKTWLSSPHFPLEILVLFNDLLLLKKQLPMTQSILNVINILFPLIKIDLSTPHF
jgi:tetratricopeptide (TPR) repeat protein